MSAIEKGLKVATEINGGRNLKISIANFGCLNCCKSCSQLF